MCIIINYHQLSSSFIMTFYSFNIKTAINLILSSYLYIYICFYTRIYISIYILYPLYIMQGESIIMYKNDEKSVDACARVLLLSLFLPNCSSSHCESSADAMVEAVKESNLSFASRLIVSYSFSSFSSPVCCSEM